MLDELFKNQSSPACKVEIHAHTDRYSPCSVIPPSELVLMAEASGYDALFLTEHGRIWSERELAGLRELATDLCIFPGIEISLPNQRDVLVLGATNPIYERLKTPEDVLAQATKDGCLTVLAHPYRYHEDLPEYCRLVDAIESRTCNHPSPEGIAKAHDFAAKFGVAEVYASDAHGLNFMNKFWIEVETAFDSPQEFRNLIVAGRYVNRTRDFDMALPPIFKTASMNELPEADLAALRRPPQPSLQD